MRKISPGGTATGRNGLPSRSASLRAAAARCVITPRKPHHQPADSGEIEDEIAVVLADEAIELPLDRLAVLVADDMVAQLHDQDLAHLVEFQRGVPGADSRRGDPVQDVHEPAEDHQLPDVEHDGNGREREDRAEDEGSQGESFGGFQHRHPDDCQRDQGHRRKQPRPPVRPQAAVAGTALRAFSTVHSLSNSAWPSARTPDETASGAFSNP